MNVYLSYKGEDYHWYYYFYDSENFKTTVEGFKNHIVAKQHAIKTLGDDIEIINK